MAADTPPSPVGTAIIVRLASLRLTGPFTLATCGAAGLMGWKAKYWEREPSRYRSAGSCCWRSRSRLRGHRHEPAVHRADDLQSTRPSPGPGVHGEHLRGHLADLLVGDADRHRHVRLAGDARRQ